MNTEEGLIYNTILFKSNPLKTWICICKDRRNIRITKLIYKLWQMRSRGIHRGFYSFTSLYEYPDSVLRI